MQLRPATPADIPLLLSFIQELAAFEKEPDAVKMTQAQLHDALFGATPYGEAIVVEVDGEPAGMASWGISFNTWTGRPALAVEDVYVQERFRGLGIGRAIFIYLAKLAVRRNYFRVEWQVLDWNAPAIRFYETLGATPQANWLKYRLAGEALASLARA